MTILAVARGRIEFDSFIGLKRSLPQVLGGQPVEPGSYKLAHAGVKMDVAVGADDSVAIITNSVAADRPRDIKDVMFGSSSLALALLNANYSVSVVPKIGEAALTLGPDKLGITLSLERFQDERMPVAIGLMSIQKALAPKTKNPTFVFGGAGTE